MTTGTRSIRGTTGTRPIRVTRGPKEGSSASIGVTTGPKKEEHQEL